MKCLRLFFLGAVAACSGVNTDVDSGTDGSINNEAGADADAATTDSGGDATSDAGTCVKTTPGGGGGCDPGTCLCASTQPATCYPSLTATLCCGQPVTCASDGGGSPDGGQCTFKHPLVDGGARFCGSGDCYCKWTSGESCYSLATVSGCCANASFTCY